MVNAKRFYSAKSVHFYHVLAGLNFLFSQNNKNNTQADIFASNIKSYHRKNEYEKPFSKSNRCCLFCSIDAMLGIDYDVLS